MLPGQRVNVLNVPIHFSSGNRKHRNTSVSSSSSELRTMNPEDKYINPRPAPQPNPARLKTSASQITALKLDCLPSNCSPVSGWSSHKRNASLPTTAVSLRSFRLPRKASMDDRGRSTSPTHKAGGLKAAFRQITLLRAATPDAASSRGRSDFPYAERQRSSSEVIQQPDRKVASQSDQLALPARSKPSSRSKSPSKVAKHNATRPQSRELALRRSTEQFDSGKTPISIPAFQSHRRRRSRSREPVPVQVSSTPSQPPKLELPLREDGCEHFEPLETLREFLSATNTPHWPSSERGIQRHESINMDCDPQSCHKRLLTLPNTPSSAYPACANFKKLPGEPARAPEAVEANLSKIAVSDTCPSSAFQSHFSQWTGTSASSYASSQWSSVLFDGKSPAFSQGTAPSSHVTSPYELASLRSPDAVKRRDALSAADAERMPSVISSSTISSYDNTSPASPASETSDSARYLKDEPTSLQKRYGMLLSSFESYKLPDDYQTSGPPPKRDSPYIMERVPRHVPQGHARKQSRRNATPEDVLHSTTVQQLMDELSYLGRVIET